MSLDDAEVGTGMVRHPFCEVMAHALIPELSGSEFKACTLVYIVNSRQSYIVRPCLDRQTDMLTFCEE